MIVLLGLKLPDLIIYLLSYAKFSHALGLVSCFIFFVVLTGAIVYGINQNILKIATRLLLISELLFLTTALLGLYPLAKDSIKSLLCPGCSTIETTAISCGGDWNYLNRCPRGMRCASLNAGPYAGGFCVSD